MVRIFLGSRVSNFLSHRIVKSLTFRIHGKLKCPCTRNGNQNHPFCPGSVQDTFIIFSSISRHQIWGARHHPRPENRGGGSRPPHTPPHFLSAAPAASPKIQGGGGGNPWKIFGKSMDRSRVFGNPDFGKKSRFANKSVVSCK